MSRAQDRRELVQYGGIRRPAAGYFGNAGTGNIRGPGLINFDVTLYKKFKITEKHSVEFRAEFFNVFNHTNFTTVSTSLERVPSAR